jgi:branched-chain amino acid transport system ATP-binding protein
VSDVLRMENVSAGYVGDIDVLRNLNLTVARGSITGLIGLNGAGKSTIMKAICGFLRPKTGRILYEGEDVTGIAPHRLIERGIGYIPQESSLFPFMSVGDNLRLPLEGLSRTTGVPGRGEFSERFEDTLSRFPELRPRLGAQAGDLSGGQQKMLEFAKAHFVRPRLCLIDEPGIGLAPRIAEQVYEWIGLFAREHMSILLVDHNVRRVVRMSGYIYVLTLGEITAEGPPEAFQGDLHEQVKAWLGVNF